MNRKIKKVLQHDQTDCAAACFVSILRYYEHYSTVAYVRNVLGTDVNGTTMLGLVQCSKHFNMNAKVLSIASLKAIDESMLPMIAHFKLNDNTTHYVVVIELGVNKVKIMDPLKGNVSMINSKFINLWTSYVLVLTPNHKFDKKKKKSNFNFYSNIIKKCGRDFKFAVLLSILISVIGSLISYYIRVLVDYVLPSDDSKLLQILAIVTILLIVFKIVVSAFRSKVVIKISKFIDASLLEKFYNHLIDLPVSFFSSRRSGEILGRVSDISIVKSAMVNIILVIFVDSVFVLLGGCALYIIYNEIFFIVFFLILLYTSVILLFDREHKRRNKALLLSQDDYSSFFVESVNGIECIKSAQIEDKISERISDYLRSVISKSVSVEYLKIIQSSVLGVIDGVGYTMILSLGGFLVLTNKMTLGELLGLSSIISFFMSPVKNIINLHSFIQKSIVSTERINDILDLKREKKNIKSSSIIEKGLIKFANASFRYGSRKKILDVVSFELEQDKCYALVGASGNGKSTLAKLLMRFYELDEGQILVDHYNICDISLKELRKSIAYVSQNVFLFRGSIIENLLMSDKTISYEDIIYYAKKTRIHDFIMSLSNNYDTIVNEKGTNLSGGQKQRIAILRALVRKPKILILDEATNNLDNKSQNDIFSYIVQDYIKCTRIIITHNHDILKMCDEILIIDDKKKVHKYSYEEYLHHII